MFSSIYSFGMDKFLLYYEFFLYIIYKYYYFIIYALKIKGHAQTS